MTPPNRNFYHSALERAVQQSGAPGAVAYVGQGDTELYLGATGLLQKVPASEKAPVRTDSIYDLASLTKVVATTTAAMILFEAGKFELDQPVSEIIPLPALKQFTFRNLFTHTTGLPPSGDWYRDISSMDEALQRIAAAEVSWPAGTRRRYSDLNFMLIGKAVELMARDSLDAFCAARIFTPLGMKDTMFKPPEALRIRCAATEKCAWRGRVMRGEVHDENAFAAGGVSGHAGLFSTAGDLALFCRALRAGKLLREDTLAMMTKLGQVPFYPWQGLGWKMDPWADGSEGFLLSRRAIGHTGWTGTSIWLDLESGLFAILLSNTCHPTRNGKDSPTLRRTFYQAVSAMHYPNSANVHTGLDAVVHDNFEALRGKRIGLLANQAAVDELGRPILEVLRLEPGIVLQRLFSPEHGFQGQAEAGQSVGKQASPIPLVSLYGKQKRPSRADLEGLDVFVADLPDIGARYYTYMATLRECMFACAEAGVRMLVLDRPNPVGGAILEGSIAQQTGSPVCCAQIPARHGMTLGELALFFQQTTPALSKLSVEPIPAANWTRELMHPVCALPWIPPSPNIPDADTALLYVGTCLVEGVNLNEGRGTDIPFQLLGAPWLDARGVADAIEAKYLTGCEIDSVTYTPHAIPGKASAPKYEGQECRGIYIRIRQRDQVRAFGATVALLRAIRQRHGKQLEFTPMFDTLAGGPWLREQILSERPLDEILGEIAAALDAFKKTCPSRYVTRAQWQ